MRFAAGTAAGLSSRAPDEGGRCCKCFPVPQRAIEFFHLQRADRNLVELLGVGAVRAFDGAVEFGRARRKHEQMQTALLASLFKLGGKLAAAIDLEPREWERACGVARYRGTQWRPKPW